jgi:hypothetical protein
MIEIPGTVKNLLVLEEEWALVKGQCMILIRLIALSNHLKIKNSTFNAICSQSNSQRLIMAQIKVTQ